MSFGNVVLVSKTLVYEGGEGGGRQCGCDFNGKGIEDDVHSGRGPGKIKR